MRVHFLQPVESASPEFPFRAGQTIRVDALTPVMEAWIAAGLAVILDDDPELAMLEPPPQLAVERRPRARGSR